jgi:uncharacterized repeat protein (TIGR01451 family)
VRSSLCRSVAVAVVAAAALALSGTALAAPTTYSSGNLATAIPDGATFESAISVPDVGEILLVTVAVNIGHGRDDDIDLDLVHPDGTAVRLSRGNGESGDNYGGGSDCSGRFTEFSDAATVPITDAAPPFIGSFKPEGGLLASLKGKASSGGWKLVVRDTAGGVVGTLWCWKLTITYAEADLSLTTTVAPIPATVGKELVYQHVATNRGPNDSNATSLSDTLPAEVAFVSAVSTQGSCSGVTTVVCDLGTLAAGASATVSIVVEPIEAGTLTNKATVAGTPDPAGAAENNTTTTITAAVGGPPGERRCTISGTSGDDVLAGTPEDDVICGLSGNDRIYGGGGNDVLYGDAGGDVLYGEEGADRLQGGAGNDRLSGGAGNDTGLGGVGDDRVAGDEGADTLTGGAGRDVLSGGEDDDLLYARDGVRDVVKGGPGKDRARLDPKRDVRRSIEKLL